MHTQNRPFSEKNLKKIFLTLKIALKTQKINDHTRQRQTPGRATQQNLFHKSLPFI